MRIKELVIKNYKNIGICKECKIIVPEVNETGSSDFVTIIGENNIGKSSILEALRLFLPENDFSSTPSLDMFPFKSSPTCDEEFMEVKVIFNELTEADKIHPCIKLYIYNDELIIRRIWNAEDLKDANVPFEVFVNERVITELNEVKTWNAKAFENCSKNLKTLYGHFCTEKNIENGTISQKLKGDFTDYVYMNNRDLVTEGDPKWFANPNGFASKIRQIMPRVIYVPAVKMINDEADANKSKSAANQIASALFEQSLISTPEITKFKTALESLKSIFNEETKHEGVKSLQNKLSKKLKRIMEVEANVDFDVPEVMEKLHLNASILLKHNNLITKPSEQGNGIQRMLILSLLELMAEQMTNYELDEVNEQSEWKRSILFLIEEPEIYLHPHLQRKMRDSLVQISKHSSAQIFCTSHSENFIDLADRHQGILLLKRNTDGTAKAIQVAENVYDGDTKSEKRNRMRMLLNFNTSTLEAFFANRVILVEGDCEVASIIAIKDKLKEKFPEKSEEIERVVKSISIIPCNGKLTQLAYYEVLKRFGIQSYLVHDLDGMEAIEGNNNNILARIGREENRLTHDKNFEEYIFGETWDSDKPWKATQRINSDFDKHYEKLMRFFKFVIGDDEVNSLGIFEADEELIS
ncbi:AAA family ATPase [Peribacillus frigoritolerans]|uniref:AAA family ATPase n=1 Tax=Peribacillus frigoritolerans TaxID=450367 RepID=UPI0039A3AB9E